MISKAGYPSLGGSRVRIPPLRFTGSVLAPFSHWFASADKEPEVTRDVLRNKTWSGREHIPSDFLALAIAARVVEQDTVAVTGEDLRVPDSAPAVAAAASGTSVQAEAQSERLLTLLITRNTVAWATHANQSFAMRASALLASALAAAFTFGLWPTAAYGSHCLDNASDPELNHAEISVWGSTGFRGTENKIQFRERELGTCVPPHVSLKNATTQEGGDLVWSTAHIRLGGFSNDIMEVGWETYFDQSGNKRHRAFTEFIRNGTKAAGNLFDPSPATCLEPGKSDVWRVKWLQYETWGLYINCIDGVGYRHLASYGNAGSQSGVTMGETGKLDEAEIHTVDLQRDLRRMSSTGAWSSWNTNTCWRDEILQWRYFFTASDAYDVNWGDAPC
jgi:hypothetical protein